MRRTGAAREWLADKAHWPCLLISFVQFVSLTFFPFSLRAPGNRRTDSLMPWVPYDAESLLAPSAEIRCSVVASERRTGMACKARGGGISSRYSNYLIRVSGHHRSESHRIALRASDS